MLIRVNAIIAIVSVVWMGLRYFLKKRYSHQSIYIWETMYWFFVLLLYPLLYILEKIQDSYLLKSFKKVTGESFAVYFPASSISSVRKVTESEYLLQISGNLDQVFQILSLLGLVAFLLFSFKYSWDSRRLKEAIPHKISHYEHSELFKKVKLDKVWVSEAVLSPLAWGIFRGKIMVAPIFLESYQEKDALILLHESIHLQRKDNLKKCIVLALTFFFWYHPLLWFQYFFFQRQVELSCDEKVLSYAGKKCREDYIQNLLKYANYHQYSSLLLSQLASSNLKRRVVDMLNNKGKKKLSLCVTGLLGVFLLLVLSFTLFSNKILAKRTDFIEGSDRNEIKEETFSVKDKTEEKPFIDYQNMSREELKVKFYDMPMEELADFVENSKMNDNVIDVALNVYNRRYFDDIAREKFLGMSMEELEEIIENPQTDSEIVDLALNIYNRRLFKEE